MPCFVYFLILKILMFLFKISFAVVFSLVFFTVASSAKYKSELVIGIGESCSPPLPRAAAVRQ